MRPVLNDLELEKAFQKNGYVEIPFLTVSEVEDLKEQYFNLIPSSGGNIGNDDTDINSEITYDFTFIDKNIEFKQDVFDTITKRFDSHVKKWLADYKPIIANYIRKKPGGGEVPLHQNWAFVDEKKCTSVSIWCPLVDSDESNGTLEVVPGSHKRFGEHRGPIVPWELEGISQKIISDHLVALPTKAGNAIILDDSIVHYTKPNSTQGLRLAIQLILVPTEEKCLHYHHDPATSSDQTQILEVDQDFFMQFNPWKKPVGARKIGSVPFRPKQLSEKEFQKKLVGHRLDEPRGPFSKLKDFLSIT